MSRDYFNAAAADWDTPVRVERAQKIAEVIRREVRLAPEAVVADYGSGTGLIAAALAPHVARVVALDNAANMLAVLADKCRAGGIANIETRLCDIETDSFAAPFCDVFVSSLVLHHLRSPERYAAAAWQALRPGGVAAVIDLDCEGGDFHTGHDEVHHHGFERAALVQVFVEAGFARPSVRTALTIRKLGRAGVERDFTLFILQARKG
ncbi:class I SAM-dependent methyltransferase [Uliginosibacterium sp. 31-16]|uniref:class I SAM-dependent methyltransferase n=1 Tax=Uliginosibacterium sp. 31-16 TaxID=3068315 RepID=UPI00273F66E1|nr:class I SAM-dependent methyltransferase [Uliginosibacterium sp. 31-16]MDP5239344.1 class I SAM-dependent methyltransferase [Uliginosibacterium sp. 31-16]